MLLSDEGWVETAKDLLEDLLKKLVADITMDAQNPTSHNGFW